MIQDGTVVRSSGFSSVLETNKVLQKTYALLAATLIFSGLTAFYAMSINAAPLGILITLVGYFGLLILTNVLKNSAWGILSVFALTGFMGYTLGPIVNMYLHNMVNGHQLVFMALSGTGIIFVALSGYALISKKDFSFMTGFIMTGAIVAFLAGLAAIFFHMAILSLAVSAAFILISSGIILIQTGAIINGGETNYVMATVTLYVSLYNIFLSLLQLLGAFNRD
ncbi:MAG TPA: Bax inhibitor-1/YccA family protein [Gammaproteobacteria bacterium]|nr:Bax inhibitor-1/YccA family protein [Gammaproteobacteria bacterium]